MNDVSVHVWGLCWDSSHALRDEAASYADTLRCPGTHWIPSAVVRVAVFSTLKRRWKTFPPFSKGHIKVARRHEDSTGAGGLCATGRSSGHMPTSLHNGFIWPWRAAMSGARRLSWKHCRINSSTWDSTNGWPLTRTTLLAFNAYRYLHKNLYIFYLFIYLGGGHEYESIKTFRFWEYLDVIVCLN